MSVELYIGKEFDTTYEREALDTFIKNMTNRFGSNDNLYIILANYMIKGRHVDLTVLKRDAVLVIELKECKEKFTAYSNKAWRTETGKLVGYDDYNPINQVDDYRNIWIEFLKENKRFFNCLKNLRNEKPFNYTKSYVAIFPSLKDGCLNEIPRGAWWFRLCGLNDLDKKISFETNKILNFSKEEMRFIATELLSMDSPRVIQATNPDNLAEQIRNGVDGLTGVIEEFKKKITQFEQSFREKEEILLGLRSSNDQLTNALRHNSDIIDQLKSDSRKREEEIQLSDIKKFHIIVKYIIYNFISNYYIKKMTKEEVEKLNSKLNSLVGLAINFGIENEKAIKIIKEEIEAGKNLKK